jgi:hypothetical protein
VVGAQGYLRAWEAIGELLQNGRSWSGRERSCGFLNTRDGRFATSAAVTRLDDPADARALGVTDWDGDGDLDVWVSNRTGPRLRLYRNPSAANTHSLKLRLIGMRCNRDAIGALVEVTPESGKAAEPISRRFVRAGEGYLAQSSKWLHFGRGDSAANVHLTITWPDGSRERIAHVAPDRAYEIVQGSGRVEPVAERVAAKKLAPEPLPAAPPSQAARIVIHRPLPVPSLAAQGLEGSAMDVRQVGPNTARLLVVWASWCQPCLGELQRLAQERDALARDGLEIWSGNVDELDAPPTDRLALARERLDQVAPGLAGGLLTREAVEHLDLMQRIVLSRQESLAVPTSFLFDSLGRLVAIYRGPVDAQQVRADLQLLRVVDPADYRNFAVPFVGRWYINAAPADLLAVANQLLQEGKADEALDYLQRYVGTPVRPRDAVDADWHRLFAAPLAGTYAQVGIELARQQQPRGGEVALQTALEIQADHWNALAALASLYGQQKDSRKELAIYERMHQTRPQDLMTANNLAWLLATSSEESLRDPARAVELAESMCEATNRRLFTPFDTLAAAYAAAGRWDDAARAAGQALQLPGGTDEARAALEQRLLEYNRRRGGREGASPDSR